MTRQSGDECHFSAGVLPTLRPVAPREWISSRCEYRVITNDYDPVARLLGTFLTIAAGPCGLGDEGYNMGISGTISSRHRNERAYTYDAIGQLTNAGAQ